MWLHVSKGVCLGLACAGLQGAIAHCLLAQLPVSTVRVQRIAANAAHQQLRVILVRVILVRVILVRVILVRASGATVGSGAEQQQVGLGESGLGHLVWMLCAACVCAAVHLGAFARSE